MSICPDVYDCDPERVAEIQLAAVKEFVDQVLKVARDSDRRWYAAIGISFYSVLRKMEKAAETKAREEKI